MTTKTVWRASLSLGVLAVAWFLFQPGCQDAENRRASSGLRKLRRINGALTEYCEKHRAMPADDLGYRYALYQLNALVDAGDFQVLDHEDRLAPSWDHERKRLLGGDIVYLNQPILAMYPARVILFARPSGDQRSTYVGYSNFTASYEEFPVPPTDRLLGSYRHGDFFAVDRRVYEELQLTDRSRMGKQWTSHWTSSIGPDWEKCEDCEMQFEYSGGRLSRCRIKTALGTIDETFETDALGRITSVSRSPNNWRELLPEEDPQDK
jgi:hypothetical protein